jgi:hypothetical protein
MEINIKDIQQIGVYVDGYNNHIVKHYMQFVYGKERDYNESYIRNVYCSSGDIKYKKEDNILVTLYLIDYKNFDIIRNTMIKSINKDEDVVVNITRNSNSGVYKNEIYGKRRMLYDI